MNHAFVRYAFAGVCALLLGVAPIQAILATETAVPAVPAAAPAPVAETAVPVAAPPVAAAPATPEIEATAELAPGEFVWQPERASAGQVAVVVSIPQQRAYVYRGGTLIGVTTVSTGRQGHETPVGSFTILEKRREHYSNLYNNAPMPFMQRLTWDGIALHAGQIPGRPASHGCVRLPLAFARHLFSATERGAAVHIVRFAPAAGEALAMVHNGGAYVGMGGPEEELPGGTN